MVSKETCCISRMIEDVVLLTFLFLTFELWSKIWPSFFWKDTTFYNGALLRIEDLIRVLKVKIGKLVLVNTSPSPHSEAHLLTNTNNSLNNTHQLLFLHICQPKTHGFKCKVFPFSQDYHHFLPLPQNITFRSHLMTKTIQNHSFWRFGTLMLKKLLSKLMLKNIHSVPKLKL